MKILKQNNVKGTLTSVEKKRFRQIGDQFFKGSYEFFVHYQETIHKTVDINIINNNFVQYFQNQLKDAKEKLIDKAQILEQEKAKEKFQNRLLNFIITLQVGIIAILKLPMDFKKIKEFSQASLDGISRGFEMLRNAAGVWVDLGSWLGEAYTSVMDDVYKGYINFGKHVVHFFRFFFFESETFTTCLTHLGIKIGNRATGAIGLIINLIKSIYTTEVYKRPKLKHWLLYGTEKLQKVNSLESEYFDNLTSSKNSKNFISSWIWGNDFQFGTMIDGEYSGVAEGSTPKIINKKTNEVIRYLDDLQSVDVKRQLESFQHDTQAAAEEVSGEYTVKSLYGLPNLLKSKKYAELKQRWNKMKNLSVDISGTMYSVPFHELIFNPVSGYQEKKGDDGKIGGEGDLNYEEFEKSFKEIKRFYKKYRKSKDPFAKSICDEIEDKILKTKFIKIDKTETKLIKIPIQVYLFMPAIYYSIVQFNFVQERNEKLIASMNRRLSKLNAELQFYVNDKELNDYRKKEQKFVDGQITFSQFAKDVAKDFSNFKFTLPEIDIKKHLTFVNIVQKTKNIIENGISKIREVASGETKVSSKNSFNYIEVSENDLRTFDEIQVGNSEALVMNISENHKVVKGNLAVAYKKRTDLLKVIKDKIISLNEKRVFVWDIHVKEGLDSALKKLKEKEENEIKKLEQDKRYQGRWNQRELSVAKRGVYAKYGVKERELKDKYKKLNKK